MFATLVDSDYPFRSEIIGFDYVGLGDWHWKKGSVTELSSASIALGSYTSLSSASDSTGDLSTDPYGSLDFFCFSGSFSS